MSEGKVVINRNGVGLGGLIFVVFLFLKLAGIAPVALWSWWWITCPLWIPFALVGVILLGIGLVALLFLLAAKVLDLFGR